MNIAFFGSPSFAVPALELLAQDSSLNIINVYTKPDKPAGRGMQLTPTAVKTAALKLVLPVIETLPTVEELRTQKIEKIVVIAYGKFIPVDIVHGWPCINLHPSLLPKYRGPSPLQTALLNGDSETGLSTMILDEGMDDGDILLQTSFALEANTTLAELHDRCARDGAKLIQQTLKSDLQAIRKPQDHSRATLCKKIQNEDSAILATDTSWIIHNKVRAIGAYATVQGKRVKIIKTLWINNSLTIETVQPEGKKPMAYSEFVNGYGEITFKTNP